MNRLPKDLEAKYEMLAMMGEGGMGSVYKVRHRLLDDVQVIKVMQAKFRNNQELRTRFNREAQKGKKLRHPNIAEVMDFSVTRDGTAFIVMEYIDGIDLRQVLARAGKPLGPEFVTVIAIQSLAAIGFLHRSGFVHRDISPDNLMVTRDRDANPLVKLIDLGIAKAMDVEQSMSTGQKFVGKIQYASPEQFGGGDGGAKVDGRSDLYSFGVVMYELLTDTEPIIGDDYRAIIAGHLHRPVRPFHETDPQGRVPEKLRSVVLRALEKNPADRFQTAEDFADAVRSLQRAAAPVAAPRTIVEEHSETEIQAWESATEADCIAVWESFIDRFPASTRLLEARKRLEELEDVEEEDWSTAMSSDSVISWRTYLAAHPDSSRSSKARRRLEKLERQKAEEDAWHGAVQVNTLTSWERFLNLFPSSDHATDARTRLASIRERLDEEIAWTEASASRSSTAWQKYLNHHPLSMRASSARSELNEAVAREAEIKAWEIATAAQTTTGWDEYLAEHGASSRAQLARIRRDEVEAGEIESKDWERAVGLGSVDAWNEYLARHGRAPRAASARRKLEVAEAREKESVAWTVAGSTDTAASWQSYLDQYPGSARSAEARARLDAINLQEAEARSWMTAEHEGSSKAWRQFLTEHPHSGRRVEVEAMVEAAQCREVELDDWLFAIKNDSVESWQLFLRKYPGSSRAEEGFARLQAARARETETIAWTRAESENSEEGWKSYLAAFPQSERAASARSFLKRSVQVAKDLTEAEAKAWEAAANADSVSGWRDYISAHNHSGRVEDARGREKVAAAREERHRVWQNAVRNGTASSFQRIVDLYPTSDEAREANRELIRIRDDAERAALAFQLQSREDDDWQKALTRSTVDAWQSFILAYPNSKRNESARARLSAALAEQRAEEEWTVVAGSESVDAIQAFLASHPTSRRSEEARLRAGELSEKQKTEQQAIEDGDWSAAATAGTPDAWTMFLAKHPHSTRRRQAVANRDRCEEEREILEWERAERTDTIEGWQSFIAVQPESQRVPEAGNRIASIQRAQREQAAWLRAIETGTETAFERFASEFPNSRHARDSADRAAALRQERFEDTSSRRSRRTPPPGTIVEQADPVPTQADKRVSPLLRGRVASSLAVAAVLIVVAGLWLNRQPSSDPVAATASTLTPRRSGFLSIDALPWAEIYAVTDSHGRNHLPSAVFTPVSLSLPEGRYIVVLRKPGSSETVSRTVDVGASRQAVHVERVDPVDADDYLRRSGFSR